MIVFELKGMESEGGVVEEKLSQWVRMEWQDIRVGDVIWLERDDVVLVDIVFLYVMNENGIVYIEIMVLDGEMNLKSKQVSLLLVKYCVFVVGMGVVEVEVVLEDLNIDFYNYEGRVMVGGEMRLLMLNEVVYRGLMFRNIKEVMGLVINIGEECKIRMNVNKNVRVKVLKMQWLLNWIVLFLVVFVFVFVGGLMVGYIMWRRDEEWRVFYFFGEIVQLSYVFILMLIVFNMLILLLMYVLLELVKLGQFLLFYDVEMYDEVNDIFVKFNIMIILEDLGCVGYVFFDKMGILIENLMQFCKMSVVGIVWLYDMDVFYVVFEGGCFFIFG